MNSEISNRFRELKVIGQRSLLLPEETRNKDLSLIEYLKGLIESNLVTDFKDIGFCYWNISDNYALVKDGHSLMENHKKFYKHIKSSESSYLFWAVCDATQRLTMEKDGYSDFWWNIYREAVQQNQNNNEHFAEFHTHRAALYINPVLTHTKQQLDFAKSGFENLINKSTHTPEYNFYRIIYLSMMSRLGTFDKIGLRRLCEDLFENLEKEEQKSSLLVGEWESFTTPFDKHRQSVIGINSAINAFIYNGEIQIAKELYYYALISGLPKTFYIEKRLK